MKLNLGILDRAIRASIGIAIGIVWYLGYLSGTVAIVLGVISVVFLLTSSVGFCPAYLPFKLNTRKDG